ncbi:MAG: alcohol dehydrogenase catalytic domain-containing protein, partial [Mycobacteriaceae bacterium]|nr:alcohol dehydrogenase catalytic domain-containing protein [Mycobacteriaceae bacterium]
MSAIAYHLEPLRGLAGLTTAPQAVPEPGPRQVVIRVKAVSFNRRDLMLIDGTYPLSAAPGVVPIADGVGDVVAVGADVTRAEIGDRVAPTYFTSYVDGPQRLVHVADQYGAIRDGLL